MNAPGPFWIRCPSSRLGRQAQGALKSTTMGGHGEKRQVQKATIDDEPWETLSASVSCLRMAVYFVQPSMVGCVSHQSSCTTQTEVCMCAVTRHCSLSAIWEVEESQGKSSTFVFVRQTQQTSWHAHGYNENRQRGDPQKISRTGVVQVRCLGFLLRHGTP